MKIFKILTLIVSLVLLLTSARAFAVETSIPALTTADPDTASVYIDLSIDDATGMSGFQYFMAFDPAVYNCSIASGAGSAVVLKGSMLKDSEDNEGLSWALSKNSMIPGQMIFSGYETNSMAMPAGYSGVVARVRCKAGSVAGASTPIDFTFNKIVDEYGIEIPSSAVGGTFQINCNAGAAEVCDGFDNNCDGQVDEGGVCGPTCTDADMDGYSAEGGACGPADCNDSDASVNPGAADSVCDGIDNNCDGTIDEGYVSVPSTCGAGACQAAGQLTCQNGQVIDSCTAGTPSAETCNGIDDDCDGSVDDGITPVSTTCGVGACQAAGEMTCQNGQMVETCTPNQPETEGPFGAPSCSDSTDNDCDGAADAADQDCVQQCVPSAEVCDGQDNDCDGLVDEDIASTPTTCGLGVCSKTGELTCQGGQMVDTCNPGLPTGADDNCNGKDENCDGTADENYMPSVTICGTGACQAAGQMLCNENHVLVNTCLPNAPQSEGPVGDQTCSDVIDNDCDGQVDSSDANCIAPRINALPALTVSSGAPVVIPVSIDDATGISGFQYFVDFDPSVLACSAASKGQLLTDAENNEGQSWSVSYNAAVVGRIILSGYETNSVALLGGSGPLAAIQCSAVGNPGASTPLSFNFAKIVDVYGNEIGSADTAGSLAIEQAVVTVSGAGYNFPEQTFFRGSLSLTADSASLATSWLKYSFKRMALSSTSITGISAASGTATLTGTGSVNGVPGCGFTATITDGITDAMGIVITPGGACTTSYNAPASAISSGNYIVVQ